MSHVSATMRLHCSAGAANEALVETTAIHRPAIAIKSVGPASARRAHTQKQHTHARGAAALA